MTACAVPPPNFAFKLLKLLTKSELLPMSRTTKARNVPSEAMIQKVFCQRNVARTPAMWIAVMSAIIAKPPMKIHRLSV